MQDRTFTSLADELFPRAATVPPATTQPATTRSVQAAPDGPAVAPMSFTDELLERAATDQPVTSRPMQPAAATQPATTQPARFKSLADELFPGDNRPTQQDAIESVRGTVPVGMTRDTAMYAGAQRKTIENALKGRFEQKANVIDTLIKQGKRYDYIPDPLVDLDPQTGGAVELARQLAKFRDKPESATLYWAERTPWAGTGVRAVQTWNAYVASRRFDKGSATRDDYRTIAAFMVKNERAAKRGIVGEIFDTATMLPAVGLEFLATAGAFRGGLAMGERAAARAVEGTTARVAQRLVGRTIERGATRVAEKGLGIATGVAAQTLLNPHRVAEAYVNQLMPEFNFKEDWEGDLRLALKFDDDAFMAVMPKAALSAYIDIGTEWAGASLIPLKGAIARRWLQMKPGRTPQMLMQVLKRTGWHGPVTEVGEEVLAMAAKAGTGVEEFPEKDASGWGRWLAVNLTAFAMPGLASKAVDKLAGRTFFRPPLADETGPQEVRDAPVYDRSDQMMDQAAKLWRDDPGLAAAIVGSRYRTPSRSVFGELASEFPTRKARAEFKAALQEAYDATQVRGDEGRVHGERDAEEGRAAEGGEDLRRDVVEPIQGGEVAGEAKAEVPQVAQDAQDAQDVRDVSVPPEPVAAEASRAPPQVEAPPVPAEPAGSAAATPPQSAPPGPVGRRPTRDELPPGTKSLQQSFTVPQRLERDPSLPPTQHITPTPDEEAWAQAGQRLQENPQLGEELLAQQLAEPRAVDVEEEAVLLRYMVERDNAFANAATRAEQARQAGDDAALADAQHDQRTANATLAQLEQAVMYALGKAGQSLRFAQVLANRDMTLQRMAFIYSEHVGRELTNAEMTKVTAEHTALVKVRDKKRVLEIKQVRDKARASIDAMLPKPTEPGPPPATVAKAATPATVVSRERRAFDKAAADFQKLFLSKLLSVSPDIELVQSAYKVVRAAVRLGIKQFADFLKTIAGKIDQRAEPLFEEAWLQVAQEEAGPDGPVAPEIAKMADKIAYAAIESGIHDREELIDVVHEELREIQPDITRNQALIAIPNYGRVVPVTSDPVRRELIGLKGEIREIAKQQTMARGRAPLATGQQRQPPTQEERRQRKITNEMKRRETYEVTDPDRQLQTTLQSLTTRLQNEIADLDWQIETRRKIVKKRPQQYTGQAKARIDALIAERDQKKERYYEIFGRPERTDAQRVATAIAALKRADEETQRRIRENDLFPGRRPSRTPTTAELTAARVQHAATRAQLQLLQALARPKRSKEDISLRVRKANALDRMADLYERMARNDYEPRPPRKEQPIDKELRDLRVSERKILRQFNERGQRERRKRRPRWLKAAMAIPEAIALHRSYKASYDISFLGRQAKWLIFAHPRMAWEAMSPSAKASLSEARILADDDQRDNRPNSLNGYYKRSGVDFTSTHGPLYLRDEAFMSYLAQSIPGMAWSARAYVAYLNTVRADLMDTLIYSLARNAELTDVELRILGNYANVVTGRGNVMGMMKAAVALAHVMFSPRFTVSRFQLLFGQPLWYRLTESGGGRARKVIAKEYIRMLSGATAFYGSAYLALSGSAAAGLVDPDDWGIEVNPLSTDFGKLRVGKWRIDVLGGMSQTIVYVARSLVARTKAKDGRIWRYNDPKLPITMDDYGNMTWRFWRNKAAPAVSAWLNAQSGKPPFGRPSWYEKGVRAVAPDSAKRIINAVPTAYAEEALRALVPISVEQVIDTIVEAGVPAGLWTLMPNLAGEGIQIHGKTGKTRQR